MLALPLGAARTEDIESGHLVRAAVPSRPSRPQAAPSRSLGWVPGPRAASARVATWRVSVFRWLGLSLTKYHRPGGLAPEMHLSWFWRLEVPGPGGRLGWSLPRPLSWACSLCVCSHVCVQSSFHTRTLAGLDTVMASFSLSHLSKGPTSKYSCNLKSWCLGLQRRNLGDGRGHNSICKSLFPEAL